MSDKKYTVVFDIFSVATGKTFGQPPIAESVDYYRGDTVTLSDEQAENGLKTGALLPAGDSRASMIRPNRHLRDTGVRRTVSAEATAAPEHAPGREQVSGDTGVEFTATADEIRAMKVGELKALAKQHGVEQVKGEKREGLVERLVAFGADRNPGQQETPAEDRGEFPGGPGQPAPE